MDGDQLRLAGAQAPRTKGVRRVTTAGPLHVTYVLVADGWNRHAQMMWLSVQSLRLHEPQSRVTLLTDQHSRPRLDAAARQLLDSVDRVVTVETPVADPQLRAFHLKTQMRCFVEGDFLYLDGDTLVVNRIADALEIDAEVAAAVDFNFDHQFFPRRLREPYARLGWTYPLPYYFNSGVVLMRDTPAVREFSREWTRRWFLLVDEGLPGDQEAFVTALFAMPIKWARLPKGYNAITVKHNYRFREARILHFFGSEEEQRGTILEHLLFRLRETGAFDEAAFRKALRERHSWGPGYEPWHLWQSRNYVRAAVLKVRKTAIRLLRA
jgi:hypothetical protein